MFTLSKTRIAGITPPPAVCRTLQQERKRRGLSADEVGRRCGMTGIHVRNCERGARIGYQTFVLWCKSLDFEPVVSIVPIEDGIWHGQKP